MQAQRPGKTVASLADQTIQRELQPGAFDDGGIQSLLMSRNCSMACSRSS